MLSYRHAFHAGNTADVLKHAVLIFCLDYLKQKESPVLCVDTHAGAGSYSLHNGYAALNREWEQGIGRFFPIRQAPGSSPARDPAKLPAMLGRYLELVGLNAAGPDIDTYPGSPLLMQKLLRPQDRLVCFELHPADFALLQGLVGRRALKQDGLAGLKALLPPPSRRACVFIDPPYELKEEYPKALVALSKALRRFPTGLYILWYPLLRDAEEHGGVDFPERLLAEARANAKALRVELCTEDRAAAAKGMYGSGLVICNPPWTLQAALDETLSFLRTLS
jgi:23S rRNA (adenine2030-N6)-methyltransferase